MIHPEEAKQCPTKNVENQEEGLYLQDVVDTNIACYACDADTQTRQARRCNII